MNDKLSLNSVGGLFAIIFSTFSLVVPIISAGLIVSGQQRKPELNVAAGPGSHSIRSEDQYRIGAGDIIEIRVFNRPQLSRDAVRVEESGMIEMPLIEESIPASCRTETELAQDIATRYLKYQRKPQVSVFVKEFNSQPVAVIGAVNQPGRFQLQRRVRLLELVAFAGGPNERAGGRINIIRRSGPKGCSAESASSPSDQSLEGDLISLDLNDTLRGGENASPYVQPGDIVSIPEAEQAFVVGNVLRPTSIPLKDVVTVSGAIAMAGGVMPDTKLDKVRIVRQSAQTHTKIEIAVNLKAIEKQQAEDTQLLPGDIVDVPTSSSKRFFRTLLSAVAPAAANAPVRVIR
jgi:polysaccharide export outer membrane protein